MTRRSETKVIANITVGKPDVKPWAPSHVPGVYQGNRKHPTERPRGIDDKGLYATSDARRSTGIRPDAHDVIDPRMPKLSPS
jgi:hypothetical protein